MLLFGAKQAGALTITGKVSWVKVPGDGKTVHVSTNTVFKISFATLTRHLQCGSQSVIVQRDDRVARRLRLASRHRVSIRRPRRRTIAVEGYEKYECSGNSEITGDRLGGSATVKTCTVSRLYLATERWYPSRRFRMPLAEVAAGRRATD